MAKSLFKMQGLHQKWTWPAVKASLHQEGGGEEVTYALVCDEQVMGVLGVDGVAGPKAEFLLMSSALLPSSSSSSASMPPSHAGDMSGY